MNRPVAFFDRARRSRDTPQLVDDERRRVAFLGAPVGLPADDPDAGASCDPLVLQNRREWPGAVARLARQAEVLKEVPAKRQRRRAGHRIALVADDHRRLAARAHDEDRFFESRVESGEVRHVRAVLAIRIDHEPVVAGGLGALAQAQEARGVKRGWQHRHRLGHAELWKLDPREIRLQRAVQPQSITCSEPVIPAAASEQRNVA